MGEPGARAALGFVRAVAVLASDAEVQVAWLSRAGAVVEELVLEFDQGHRLLPAFVDSGWIDAAAVPALAELDRQLDEMGGDHQRALWTAEALATRPEWDRVRFLARAALILLP
ncbi:hypothetical protein Aph02nite_81770 [Actinoplanes philippinensis]|uniref:hypothetical protein n=1 Tax=Actinoplanes philippinensis TaxID=35752 RepID=UPI0011605793|nr:hypothetical protein [Actinoplanes philippinensis]GIE82227.1 hypothetical protein Aph02nite_81770 [Actinoplanes philippinensis]